MFLENKDKVIIYGYMYIGVYWNSDTWHQRESYIQKLEKYTQQRNKM